MHQLKITASDGEVLTGQLPESWAEVPLAPYVALALAAQPVPAGITPTVHPFANPAGCEALATLLGLPTAEPFLASLSLLLPIYDAAPWLFDGPLPAAGEPAPSFTHLGTAYTHTGAFDDLTAGQWEALSTFLQGCEGNPLRVAPQLLAVLYCPAGQPQSAVTVRDAAQAFETLPMRLAWPAIQSFLLRALPLALPIQRYLAARPLVEQVVHALEQGLATSPTSAPRGFYWSMGRWLAKRWLKLVRRQLATFLPSSATTAVARHSRSTRNAKAR
ncbi:hypothetical protein [Hymenobacter cheonanensis]|uniref:hypothetical protein n=1 Tax=Hymenobacter sp. CA2-7 TaxID=3063993 RepID=UPI0027138E45|nr:hypothetical protein [Hymenobacter sp. CA2-7]MDO7885994.1 hypothetical protein [Hymenobacter sp. CA2-7]